MINAPVIMPKLECLIRC